MNQSAQLSIDETFEYVIKRQRRKTIALHVLDDATVEVRAPKWVAKFELINFVEQRASWVLEQRQQRLKKLAAKPSFSQGQYHPYLGQQYPLHITQGTRSCVSLARGVLLVSVPEPSSSEKVKKTLQQWYRLQAMGFFEERMFACFEAFPDWFQDKYRVPEISVRKMRRRWGSCSSKGDVTLNMALIKMPASCIDYVIIHELCHLEVFHHGKPFYQLLASVLPSWREQEILIESLAQND